MDYALEVDFVLRVDCDSVSSNSDSVGDSTGYFYDDWFIKCFIRIEKLLVGAEMV